MMIKKLNSLTVLFMTTVFMVLLMLLTIYSADDNTDDFALLFPELYSQLSEVNEIRFSSSQGDYVLKKEGEDWYLPNHFNYPANFNDVKRLLIDLSEAKTLERKTSDANAFPILGVEGSEEGGDSLQVSLLADNEQVAGLILGNQREVTDLVGPQQFYVRRIGEERAWLAEGYLQISPVMLNWIDGQIIDLARERIAKVEIIQPDGATAVLINLGAKDKFGTPEDRSQTIFKYAQLGYDIAGSLYQLRMEDVQPKEGFSRGESEVVTARFTTFDGLVISAKTSFIDGYYYSSFATAFDEAVIQAAPEDIKALDVIKPVEAVRVEAEKLNKRLAPWIYRVSGFVGTNLMRAKADMVTVRNQVIPMPADLSGFGPAR